MIPTMIEAHLRQQHLGYEHHIHPFAMTAQQLAASEHVSGRRVAKPVVVQLDGRWALAVVAATDKVNLAALEEATGCGAELVPEAAFATRFAPCQPGSEPPLAVFGLPIFVDEKLEQEPSLLMSAGTHEDSVVLDTHEWMRCERVQPVAGLGLKVG
jgi:Ala-tRNA(Pro) deacylase